MAKKIKTPYDAGDADQVRGAKNLAEVLEQRIHNGIVKMMADSDIRFVMASFLQDARIFADNFNPDPYENAFNGGFRNAGLWWMSKLMLHDPEFLNKMAQDSDNPLKAKK